MARSRRQQEVVWGRFLWDATKEGANIKKHGIAFRQAVSAFLDPGRIIIEDLDHSESEDRFLCIGSTDFGIITVRFTWRGKRLRIIGAGLWREGKKTYEEKNEK